jgi:hypothetical protein
MLEVIEITYVFRYIPPNTNLPNLHLRDHTCRYVIFNGSDHPLNEIAGTKQCRERNKD